MTPTHRTEIEHPFDGTASSTHATDNRMTPTRRTEIEQTLARTQSRVETMRETGCTYDQVREVVDSLMARRKPCGTHAAYMRHLRNKEPACDLCLAAVADKQTPLAARL